MLSLVFTEVFSYNFDLLRVDIIIAVISSTLF